MASGRSAVIRRLDTLYRIGSLGVMSDGQLLERFVDRRDGDEAAFEALVARHGPMVLGVCRQILGTRHDAEDAFQATFLVLVRRAGSIRKRESLAPWLHGVARRIALRNKSNASKRRRREEEGAFRVVGAGDGGELAASLHDEISRLPEKYRSPIVLCDLEGHTHAEAAKRLQWPIGTVSGRLSRARDLLRGRIARRGLALSTAGLVTVLSSNGARAAIPETLARSTTAAALAALGSATVSAVRFVVASAAALLILAGSAGYGISTVLLPETPVSQNLTNLQTASNDLPAALPDALDVRLEAPAAFDPIEVTSLAWSPDGRMLAAGSRDATITIWDLVTGRETATLSGHSAPIDSLAFFDDGRTLASTAEDHFLTIWDVSTGRALVSAAWPESADPLVLGPAPSAPDRGGLGRG